MKDGTVSLQDVLAAFPLRTVAVPGGRIEYRHAGGAPRASAALVLLHGIGSASASWVRQLRAAPAQRCVLAWNAPGYGASTPLAPAAPAADDYARRVWNWLDALGIEQATLVGHSLGALMAAAAVAQAPSRVERLVLLAPASGYGDADPAVRAAKLEDRLANLRTLGPAGMAAKRGAAMLSPTASADEVAFIRSVMAEVDPHGYTQAAHMLAQGRIAHDLARISCPVTVASGSADTITPVAGCRGVAVAARTALVDLGPVGHACALEAADAVNRLLG
ncbi:MAG: alpha/beta fold hydrolase, partial [Burkholderiales bacterium]|nr:alpha/beta fold hydrolase [Burkholderiales bacterium]